MQNEEEREEVRGLIPFATEQDDTGNPSPIFTFILGGIGIIFLILAIIR